MAEEHRTQVSGVCEVVGLLDRLSMKQVLHPSNHPLVAMGMK